MTETNDESEEQAEEETPFDKLELAKEHTDRAERLRAEAKRHVLENVQSELPFPAEIHVTLARDVFIVNVTPSDVLEGVDRKFEKDVEELSSFRFRIGGLSSVEQREQIQMVKDLLDDIAEEFDEGAPVDVFLERCPEIGLDPKRAEETLEKLKQKGEVYEPSTDHLRTT